MAKIDILTTRVYRPTQPSYVAGEVLRRTRQNATLKDKINNKGLVTTGHLSIVQGTGGFGWAVSDYIEFSYKYLQKPVFTWGQEGTYSGNTEAATPYGSTGNNVYSRELPAEIQSFIDLGDVNTWQPAVFVPRVIHWHKENEFMYVGCYILVIQVNPNCTEINKKMRLHFRFEGNGTL